MKREGKGTERENAYISRTFVEKFHTWFLNYDCKLNGRQRGREVEREEGERECVFPLDVCCVVPYMVPYD